MDAACPLAAQAASSLSCERTNLAQNSSRRYQVRRPAVVCRHWFSEFAYPELTLK
jgi:hypothetical protein